MTKKQAKAKIAEIDQWFEDYHACIYAIELSAIRAKLAAKFKLPHAYQLGFKDRE